MGVEQPQSMMGMPQPQPQHQPLVGQQQPPAYTDSQAVPLMAQPPYAQPQPGQNIPFMAQQAQVVQPMMAQPVYAPPAQNAGVVVVGGQGGYMTTQAGNVVVVNGQTGEEPGSSSETNAMALLCLGFFFWFPWLIGTQFVRPFVCTC